VIVLDANLLLYAYDTTSPQHPQAREWLMAVFASPAPIGFPWLTVWAFLRISTNERAVRDQLPMNVAIEIAESWIARPQVRLLSPTDGHWEVLKRMLINGQVRGPMTTDAQLAALTIEYGGVLHTTDRDFARFPGLSWRNPLQDV
jgi:toxin-antitoxin system PIN domain toxin